MEFKPGALVLIIAEQPDHGNVGKSGTLAFLVGPGKSYVEPVSGRRVQNGSGCEVWVVVGESLCAANGGGFCQKVRCNLMLIGPDPEAVRSTEKEEGLSV